MKPACFLILILLLASLLAACAPQGQPPVTAVPTAAPTQSPATATAAPPKPAPTAVSGVISGAVGLMAPPTPHMNIYALDPATGKWAAGSSAANPDSAGVFSLAVEPGSYQVFAFSDDNASAVYSLDGKALALVSVAAGQTVSNIAVQFPGQGVCGIAVGSPASPDGKFKAVEGALDACLASLPPSEGGPQIAKDQPIRFATGPLAVELAGAVIRGQRDRYTLSLLAGEILDVLISSLEGNAVFTILGPDQQPLMGTEEGKDTIQWSVPIQTAGVYAIVVGPTRGNATYTLKVNVIELR
jgi:hypothetical protein